MNDMEQPDRIQALLSTWSSSKTRRTVQAAGVTPRNWEIFHFACKSKNGRTPKLRKVANTYGISVPRVSKILKTVRLRLCSPDNGLTDTARMRIWQQSRIAKLRDLHLSETRSPALGKLDYYDINRSSTAIFKCGSRTWRLQGTRRWRSPFGNIRFIIWIRKPSDAEIPALGFDAFCSGSLLRNGTVFDDGHAFYVCEDVVLARDKPTIVRLKPAPRAKP